MTEDEAISILEAEFGSSSGWLPRARRDQANDGAPLVHIYEALSAVGDAWAETIFVPKRAVLPRMQVDSAPWEMTAPQFEVPDDLPNSLGDLLVRVEKVLYGNDADHLHLERRTFGQNHRTVVWGPNSGLPDGALGRVFELLDWRRGRDGRRNYGSSPYRKGAESPGVPAGDEWPISLDSTHAVC
jgi:hypothetical protein